MHEIEQAADAVERELADLRAKLAEAEFEKNNNRAKLEVKKRELADLRAKLAVAVEALEKIANMPDYRLPKPQDRARAALAQIKGDE